MKPKSKLARAKAVRDAAARAVRAEVAKAREKARREAAKTRAAKAKAKVKEVKARARARVAEARAKARAQSKVEAARAKAKAEIQVKQTKTRKAAAARIAKAEAKARAARAAQSAKASRKFEIQAARAEARAKVEAIRAKSQSKARKFPSISELNVKGKRFKVANPANGVNTPLRAEKFVRVALGAVAGHFPPEQSHIFTFVYQDGSVDGELRIKISESFTVDQALDDAADSIQSGALVVGQRFWLSMGVFYQIREDSVIYRRARGLNQASTHWQRVTGQKVVEVLEILKHIMERVSEKYGYAVDSIFVRFHWNVPDEKPRRP